MSLRELSNDELSRAIIHARNRRDAFAFGREPAEVMTGLSRLLVEQVRRRQMRAFRRQAGLT